jgi:hypothetical protein
VAAANAALIHGGRWSEIPQLAAGETSSVDSPPTLDTLVRRWLRARQDVRGERIGSARSEAAVTLAEAAGSACLARIVEIEGEIVPPPGASREDRPISAVIADAILHTAPGRALGK